MKQRYRIWIITLPQPVEQILKSEKTKEAFYNKHFKNLKSSFNSKSPPNCGYYTNDGDTGDREFIDTAIVNTHPLEMWQVGQKMLQKFQKLTPSVLSTLQKKAGKQSAGHIKEEIEEIQRYTNKYPYIYTQKIGKESDENYIIYNHGWREKKRVIQNPSCALQPFTKYDKSYFEYKS